MLVTFVLLYIGLTIVGLDFAIFFAVLSALLVVVPYFGAFAGGIPPVLFGSPTRPARPCSRWASTSSSSSWRAT